MSDDFEEILNTPVPTPLTFQIIRDIRRGYAIEILIDPEAQDRQSFYRPGCQLLEELDEEIFKIVGEKKDPITFRDIIETCIKIGKKNGWVEEYNSSENFVINYVASTVIRKFGQQLGIEKRLAESELGKELERRFSFSFLDFPSGNQPPEIGGPASGRRF